MRTSSGGSPTRSLLRVLLYAYQLRRWFQWCAICLIPFLRTVRFKPC
jgi:hypothetical protein